MLPTIENVQALTEEAWRSVLGATLVTDEAALAPDDVPVTSCVHITGGWDGAVVICCSRVLARTVTEEMFGMEPGDAGSEEIEDAVGELANIIGGGLKSLLPGPSVLSLPTVTDGAPMAFPGTAVVVSESFRSGGEPVVVSVRRRNAAPADEFESDPTNRGAQR